MSYTTEWEKLQADVKAGKNGYNMLVVAEHREYLAFMALMYERQNLPISDYDELITDAGLYLTTLKIDKRLFDNFMYVSRLRDHDHYWQMQELRKALDAFRPWIESVARVVDRTSTNKNILNQLATTALLPVAHLRVYACLSDMYVSYPGIPWYYGGFRWAT